MKIVKSLFAEPPIFYEVIVKLVKRKTLENEFEFIETREDFWDDSPILARKAAFDYYQNYVDVILESMGFNYESERQAKKALKTLLVPPSSTTLDCNNDNDELSEVLGSGIAIRMVITDYVRTPFDIKFHLTPFDTYIHGIGGLLKTGDTPDLIMDSLRKEYSIYKEKNLDTENFETQIVFCDSLDWEEDHPEEQPQTHTILRTPFDWTGLDKPYWWGKPNDTKGTPQKVKVANSSVIELISKGESNQLEFKPSLLYNYKTQAGGIGIKNIIAKTISAFLNSNGGYLLIGVNDDGNVQGLEHDFSLSEGKEPRDFFRLQFDDTINQFLPKFVVTNISAEFVEHNGKEVFVVTIFPSKLKPVFLNGRNNKEFWVRWTASSRAYEDVEEVVNYCLEHWGKDN